MTSTRRFARHAIETPFADMPVAAIEAAKIFILDTIGVGIAGAAAPLSAAIRKAAKGWGAASSNAGANALGAGLRLPPSSAAFVNAFQIHCQEFDCVHEPAVVHPMATVFSACLAEAERQGGVTGAALIAAVIVGVDVATGLGVAARSPIRFFRPATAGIFGATLAVARLRGFTVAQAEDALGHALAHASGTMQAHVEGTPALPVQIANAARASLVACDLAAARVSGPHDVFEGPFGYLPLFETAHDLAPVAESLGRVWRITEVSHKPFPTGRAAQGGIVLMRILRDKGAEPDAVDSITLSAPPLIRRLVGRPATAHMAPPYARLCFPYLGAVALRRGAPGLADFSPEKLADAPTLALAARLSIEEDGSRDPAAFVPQRAFARLKDGREIEARIDRLYGAPADPLTRAARLQKFRDCVAYGFEGERAGVADALIERLERLEMEKDCAALARLAAGVEERNGG